ncbi:MAG: DUF3160 domain-containing protein [Firmicutes bacterium]|nr:DUF3160 domain-containing protein [Bacillota bacterium]
MRKNKSLRLISAMLVIVLLTGMAGCKKKEPATVEASPPASRTYSLGQWAAASGFAAYREEPVTVKPAVPDYQVAADLNNVINKQQFEFSPDALRLLTTNSFVVAPAKYTEFYDLYDSSRYEYVANFVTTDAMMHSYHLYFDHLLSSVEKQHLYPTLKKLNRSMLDVSIEEYQGLKGTGWENAARRNVAYFAVAERLLDPAAQVPAEVSDIVGPELELINRHDGIGTSPVMNVGQAPDLMENLKADYTQYIPRGHYTRSEDLKRYFLAMMWYGQNTFRLKNEDETRSAVLITLAMNQGDIHKDWDSIYEPTCFFVGKSDDLNCNQYQNIMLQTYGQLLSLDQLAGDAEKWRQFLKQTEELEPPMINSIPIFDETIQPDRTREIKGFRFMGQRFTLDASVFQRLIYREVKENPQGERRMLPRGLDIPAAMGSDTAYSILKGMGETSYQGYSQNLDKMRDYIAGLPESTWTQNLYWSWLHTLQPLVSEKKEGYPRFMRNEAWARKELSTYLGSWTELKHDTVLYGKAVMAEMGGDGVEQVDDRGYVEPNPLLYSRLAALSAQTREGLSSRGMLGEDDRVTLERIEQLSLKLKAISEKELSNTPRSQEEYNVIRFFGGELEHIWIKSMQDDDRDFSNTQAPVVVDVANSPSETLEEGVGYIYEIYVVVPVDGILRIARGGVFSSHEFVLPSAQRLTDEEWQQMLEEGKAPPLPAWTRSFTSTGNVRVLPPWRRG